jgi:hypothetical protein
MKVLMKCGHTAQATDEEGNPVCAICIGITPGARIPVEPPKLEGREAVCMCGNRKPSSLSLAFFEYLPKQKTDRFYCGCKGWD